jgi:hypothetical protein
VQFLAHRKKKNPDNLGEYDRTCVQIIAHIAEAFLPFAGPKNEAGDH